MLDIILLLLIIIIIFDGLYILNKRNKNKAPVFIKAVAISKNTKTQSLISSSPRAPINTVCFALDNGKRIKFMLDTAVFEKIPLKKNGTLSYQGTEFNGFETD